MTNADAKATYEADGTTIKDPAKEPVANVEIKSIKFTFVSPNAAEPAEITALNIGITFPIAGWAPSSSIESTDVEGSVKFVPNPATGVFERSTIYRAEITITPKAGKYIPLEPTFTFSNVSGVDLGTGDATTAVMITYDPVKGIVYTENLPVTGATDAPNPIEGAYDGKHGTFTPVVGGKIVFDLNSTDATATGNLNYIKTNYSAAVTGKVATEKGKIKAPFTNAGDNEIYSFVKNGLNLPQRGDAWRGVDLKFIGDNSLNLDLENKSYKITFWGNLNGAPGGNVKPVIHVPYTATPWNSDNLLTDPPTLTALFDKFEATCTITPANWAAFGTANPGGADGTNRVRIRLSDTADTIVGGKTAFRISRLTIEELP